MTVLGIPNIFFSSWFWFSLIAVIIVIHYFFGKTPPPPKKSEFFERHKKSITRLVDIFIIFTILFTCIGILYSPASTLVRTVSNPFFEPQAQQESLQFAWTFLLICAIGVSGPSGALFGLLSVFHSNLTRAKRFILLITCLVPAALTLILLRIEPAESHWPTIKLGLIHSVNCWIINSPAIVLGRHFIWFGWQVLRKLRLVSGEYSG